MIPIYLLLAYLYSQILGLGPTGIAMALCSTYFIMNMVRVITINKLYGINMLKFDVLRVILAAVITAVLFGLIAEYGPFNLLNGVGMLPGIILIFVLYGFSLMLIALKKSDKKQLKSKFLSK